MYINGKIVHKLLIAFLLMQTAYIKNTFAQVPDWEWAKDAGGPTQDYSSCISTDNTGNVYACGYYKSAAINFGNTTLANANVATLNVFIVKYDAAGNVIWANGFGENESEVITSCVNDNTGNLYVTGYFNSPMLILGTDTLINQGNYDFFIVKYNPSGNVLWSKSAGDNGFDRGNCITMDNANHIYVTGFFDSAPITFDGLTLQNAGAYDAFTVKYDTLGNAMWAESIGNTGFESGSNVIFDANGNFYLTGSFNSADIIIGGITYINDTVGTNDIFLIKYNPNGNVLWAKTAGGSNNDGGCNAAIDLAGNVYFSGVYFLSSIAFGNDTLTNTGFADIFIVKYDSLGNIIWVKDAGSIGWDYATGYTDHLGDFYLLGGFDGASLILGTDTIYDSDSTVNNAVIFIAKYDSLGNIIWVKSTDAPAVGVDGVAFDNLNNIYIAGDYGSNINFGTTSFSNAGASDVFVAKLNTTIVGLEQSVIEPNTTFHPNPFNTLAVKHLKAPIQGGVLFVFNQFGQMVKQINDINGKTITIHRDNLPNGIYFTQVTEKGEIIATDKLIISN
jgi:hypothetical protein